MKTLMKIGDYLYLDSLDIDITNESDDDEVSHEDHSESFLVDCSVYKHYCGYGFNWPYFSYGSKNCDVFVYNAFNPTFI